MNQIDSEQVVREAYTTLAEKLRSRPFRYSPNYMLAKFLSDNYLLGQIELKDKKVLNVGCGEPIDEVFYAPLVAEWCSIDINSDIVRISSELIETELPENLARRVRFVEMDATKMTFEDETFDVVVSLSTVDHIPTSEKRRKAVAEMCRVLKRGGYLVITVPNRWSLYWFLASVIKQRLGTTDYGYEHSFSPLELRKMIRANGLKILQARSTSYNPHSFTQKSMRALQIGRIALYLGRRFGYLAQKP